MSRNSTSNPKRSMFARTMLQNGQPLWTLRGHTGEVTDSLLEPDAIARTYLDVHRQHRSAWTWEVELRPWVEKF